MKAVEKQEIAKLPEKYRPMGAWKYFLRTLTVPAPASRLPQGILTASLLIAMACMTVICLQKIIKSFMDFKNEKKEGDS